MPPQEGRFRDTAWAALLTLGLFFSPAALSQPGSVDPAFNASGGGPNNGLHSLLVLPDRRVLVGGSFTQIGDTPRARIARLNADGTLDPSFDPGAGANAPVDCLAAVEGGRYVIGGQFSTFAGENRAYLVGLRNGGSLDPDFNLETPLNGPVDALAVLPGGDLLVGGRFSSPRPSLVRLRPDGALLPSFNADTDGAVYAIGLDADGRIAIGGTFSTVNGVRRPRVARLLPDGSLDPAFDPGQGPNGAVWTLQPTSEGGLLIGGEFSQVHGGAWTYFARLAVNGLPDGNLPLGQFNSHVYSLAQDADGRIVVGGQFSLVEGSPRGRIARLRSDGTLDPSFDVGSGADNSVADVAIAPDGSIVLGGAFTQVNGFSRPYLAQLAGLSTAAGGEFEFAASQYLAHEGDPQVVIIVRRTGNTSVPATVEFATANDTATAGDYTPQADELLFAAGETSKSITLRIRSDTIAEDEETFFLHLSNPTGGAQLGSRRSTTVVIRDDDESGRPGGIEGAFAARPNGTVHAIAVAPDGRLVIGGEFSAVNGESRLRVARLQPDGTLDAAFAPRAWFDNTPFVLAVQDNGAVVAGGQFQTANGERRPGLVRFRSNGNLDPTFTPGDGAAGAVHDLLLLEENDLLIGGTFTRYDGTDAHYLARLYLDGTRDPAFNASANGPVYALARQSDGRFLLAGEFTAVNDTPRHRVARLHPDGSLDVSFNPGQGPNSTVWDLQVAPDGGVILGGSFSVLNGGPWQYLARLGPDGLPDLSFSNPGLNSTVQSLAVAPDGSVVAGGTFTSAGGETRNRILRVRRDGVLDPTFDAGTGADNEVRTVALEPDGNLLVGGRFERLNNYRHPFLARLIGVSSAPGGVLELAAPAYAASEASPGIVVTVRRSGNGAAAVNVDYATSNGTATAGDYTPQSGRLSFGVNEFSKTFTIPIRPDTLVEDDETLVVTLSNPGGGAELGPQRTATITLLNDDDTTTVGAVEGLFAPRANGPVHALAITPEGKVVLGGQFTAVNHRSRLRLARVHPDGTLDDTFSGAAWLDSTPHSIAVQPDGRIVVGGAFGTANGIPRRYVARFLDDGTLDPTFVPGDGPNSTVQKVLLLPAGDLLVAGSFSQYSGHPAPYVARLFSDGTVDATFAASPNGTIYAMALQEDGRLLIGGDFTQVEGRDRARVARLHPNGSLDATFDPGEGPNSSVLDLAVAPNGEIVLGGAFSLVNAASWTYLARLQPTGQPVSGFTAGAVNSTVQTVATTPDGRLLAGGWFTTLAGGEPRQRFTRLQADGSADPAFASGSGANATVRALVPQPDGNILVAGDFTEFDGLQRGYLARVVGLSSAAGGEVEFAEAASTASEADSSVTVTVRRRGTTSTPITVDYATRNGTANAGDYIAQSGTLIFGAGEVTKTIVIPIRPDATVEDDETLVVELSNPTAGALLGAQRTTTVTLLNDDETTVVGAVSGMFRPAFNGPVFRVAVDAEGRTVAAGSFQIVEGQSRLRLARLLPDGSLDPSFNPNARLNGTAYALHLQPDGRIVVGGAFTQANGVNRNRLARFLADGSLDTTFDPGTGPNGDVWDLVLLPSGDFLVGGAFSQFSGSAGGYLVRLYSDGSLDPAFRTFANSTVYALEVLPDGRIYLGGSFTEVAGTPRARVARLTADGALDPAFDPGAGPDNSVYSLTGAPDGGVFIGGHFGSVAGVSRLYFARLQAHGPLDETFTPPTPNNYLWTVRRLPGDRLLIGGAFTALSGVPRGSLARLRPDGSIDPEFDTGTGANGLVRSFAPHPDGSLTVGGEFTQLNGLSRPYLGRLIGEPTAGAPVRFTRIVAEGGLLRLTVSGRPGQRFVLERSDALPGWTPGETYQLTSDALDIQDASPGTARVRLYRARMVP